MEYFFESFKNYLDNEIKKSIAKGEAIGQAKGEAIGQAKGEAIGQARGEAIGQAKGEAIGIAKSRKEMIESLLESGMDIPTIARNLKMSPADIDQILKYQY